MDELQNKLESLSEKILMNQESFIIMFLSEYSLVVTVIQTFHMNETECVVTFSTSVGIRTTSFISTTDVITWSKTV